MLYKLLRPLLFALNPEVSHTVTMKAFKVIHALGLMRFYSQQDEHHPITLMGLTFQNRIGLAAGLDKNADYIDDLATLGFGFIEIGTVTPRPQKGNPRPRLFRLAAEEAIINRMGFNNKGIDYVAKKLEKINYRGILGINIGKNSDTPLEKAYQDYLAGFQALWKFASYFTINISSPNTPGLRNLQKSEWLTELLSVLKAEQHHIYNANKKYIPLVVKISPDLNEEELKAVANVLLEQKMDSVIATNTALDRKEVKNLSFAQEAGGLSGRPIAKLSSQIILKLSGYLQNKIPIIASGGVMDEKTATEKIQAGASLLQVYSGLIYRGPKLIKQLNQLEIFSKT